MTCMEMLAIRVGWKPNATVEKYAAESGMNKFADVQCPTCEVTYALYGNFLAEDETPEQVKWLSEFVAQQCPEHRDFIKTPDRPE